MRVFRTTWALLSVKSNHENDAWPDDGALSALFLQSTFVWFAFLIPCSAALARLRSAVVASPRDSEWLEQIVRRNDRCSVLSSKADYDRRRPMSASRREADSHSTQRLVC